MCIHISDYICQYEFRKCAYTFLSTFVNTNFVNVYCIHPFCNCNAFCNPITKAAECGYFVTHFVAASAFC